MTKTQAIWVAVIGAAAAAVLVVLHLLMPIDASWKVNRILHYAWDAVVVLAATGGVTWMMWPRAKHRRRDVERIMAQRKVIGVGVVVVLAAGLVVFSEMTREMATKRQLSGAATDDVRAIGVALGKYAAEHDGARPPAIEALVPDYLSRDALYFACRAGPVAVKPPPVLNAAAEPPSFALAKRTPLPEEKPRAEDRILAYLRPGSAWAPMTVILGKDGKVDIVSEDFVRPFEAQFEKK